MTLRAGTEPSGAEVLALLDAVSKAPRLSDQLAHRQQRPLEAPQREIPPLLQWLCDAEVVAAPQQVNWELCDWYDVYQRGEEAAQRVQQLIARQKTIQLQLRNLEKELEKRSLFGDKKKQQNQLRHQLLFTQLQGLREEHSDALRLVESRDEATRALVAHVDQEPSLRDARWFQGVICWLDEGGVFLQETLTRFDAALDPQLSLSEVLRRGLRPS